MGRKWRVPNGTRWRVEGPRDLLHLGEQIRDLYVPDPTVELAFMDQYFVDDKSYWTGDGDLLPSEHLSWVESFVSSSGTVVNCYKWLVVTDACRERVVVTLDRILSETS